MEIDSIVAIMGFVARNRSILIALMSLVTAAAALRPLPDLPVTSYSQAGDLTLGGVMPIHRFDHRKFCSQETRELGALQRVEAMAFAVKEINKRTNLLPNITLGFSIFDDCSKDTTALVRGLHFVQSEWPPNCTDASDSRFFSLDAVGVIGCESSRNTVQMAELLSVFRVPLLSYLSTSPVLSNKDVYKYFARLVPPDTFQAKAITDVLRLFNWTYTSIIYAEGSYGTEGYRALKSHMETVGFCIAVARVVKQSFGDKEYNDVVTHLQRYLRAKIVIIFTPLEQARKLLAAVKRNNCTGKFTFIGSDGWGRNIQDYRNLEDVALGAVTMKILSRTVPRFDKYFKALGRDHSKENPWFGKFLANHFNCQLDRSGSGANICKSNLNFGESYLPETTVSLVIDAVYAYAHVFHNLVSAHCPGTIRELVRSCVTSERILDGMKTVKFTGDGGLISFDDSGDGFTRYEIRSLQLVGGRYRLVTVGWWDRFSQNIQLSGKPIKFNPLILDGNQSFPRSICSDRCFTGQQYVIRENRCCWYCESCRANERTVQYDGFSKCVSCVQSGDYTWPDGETRTRCEPIPVSYMGVTEIGGIAVLVVDVLLLLFLIVVSTLFAVNRSHSLIKASSRELAYMMLAGVLFSCAIVACCVAPPTDVVCVCRFVGFHLSFTTTYGPLLVKTSRIYRIFESGKRSVKRPRLTDSRSQIIMALVIVVLQVVLLTAWVAADIPVGVKKMPNSMEKYVEVACVMPKSGFIAALVYNMLVVMACTFYAVKTRKLPENYNESKFISFSVYTTIILWLAFIPSYFSSTTSFHRSLFLSVAMISNSLLILSFLFLPKLFAIYFADGRPRELARVWPRAAAETRHERQS